MISKKIKYCQKCQGQTPHAPLLMGSEIETLVWKAVIALFILFFSVFGLLSSINILEFCIFTESTEIFIVKSDFYICISSAFANIALMWVYQMIFRKHLACEICYMRTIDNIDNLL